MNLSAMDSSEKVQVYTPFMSLSSPRGNTSTQSLQGIKNNMPAPSKGRSSSSKKLEKPKRPLNSYNIFFRSERQRLLAKLPVRAKGKPRNSHGKIGFEEMARAIGKAWKSLDKSERDHYNDLAAKEKEDYSVAMEEYKQQQAEVASSESLANQQVPSMENRPLCVQELRGIKRVANQLAPHEVDAIIRIFG